jgi:hypothetical protein
MDDACTNAFNEAAMADASFAGTATTAVRRARGGRADFMEHSLPQGVAAIVAATHPDFSEPSWEACGSVAKVNVDTVGRCDRLPFATEHGEFP